MYVIFLFCTWTDDTVRCAAGLRKVLLIELTFFSAQLLSKTDPETQCCGEGAKGQSYKPGGRTSCCYGKLLLITY